MECPKCLGVKILMTPKETRGFEFKDCDICEGKGVVLPDLHLSFVDSQKPFEDDEFSEY